MLRIVHFIPSMQRGGAERQAACIINNCVEFEQWLVALYNATDSYLPDNNQLLLIRGRQFLLRLREFSKMVRDLKPDLIYTWGVLPFLLAHLVSLGRKIKVVNGSIRHGVFKRSMVSYLRLILLHLSRYVVANSRAGIKANRLKQGLILYNGIDERFNRAKADTRLVQAKAADKLVLISVANLVPYKDYETVFQALQKLIKEGLNFSYLIIGDGAMRKVHEDSVRSLGLESSVVFLGRVSNPEIYLVQADIFIHSSKGEGCSNAILEAMYMGLPIIATDTGGTIEIVGSNAMLFTYQDVTGLYQALTTVIKDKGLRIRMGEESYRIVCEKFTISRMTSDYSRIIKAVVNEDLVDVSDLRY